MKNIALLGCGGMGNGHANAIASGSGNPIWAGVPGIPEGKLHETDSDVGKVLTHTFITQQIWGRSWENDVASLRVFMATLRKKLEKEPGSPQYIQTHIGVGYRMLKVE